MHLEFTVPELLAPAGSIEALNAAIAAGADAVYLGGFRFSARHFAANFSDDLIADAVRYAHIRGVKIYVTVNTLIADSELEDGIRYLLFLYRIGVDAVLIQDLGLLSLSTHLIPGLQAHASTQMGVHNEAGVLFVGYLGVKRVVLARETTASEVQEISDALGAYNVGLEVFVHGALCYAYSGFCLFSALIGGRSGNRGMCAQPCRKPYVLMYGDSDRIGRMQNSKNVSMRDHYLLSTRDLCTYENLNLISRLPVSSLKIEGRMRSPAYVATVVSIYRRALDSISIDRFSPDDSDKTALTLAYSRGFTDGYLSGATPEEVLGRARPDSQGIFIGKVIRSGPNEMVIKPAGAVVPKIGDGMVCIHGNDKQGFKVQSHARIVHNGLSYKVNIQCKPGDEVCLTSSVDQKRWVQTILNNPDARYIGSIGLSTEVDIDDDGRVTVTAETSGKRIVGVKVAYQSEYNFTPAKTSPVSEETILKSLKKTGESLFRLDSCRLYYPGGLFAPISMINAIRREIFDHVTDALLISVRPDPDIVHKAEKKVSEYLDGWKSLPLRPNSTDQLKVCVIVSDKRSAEEALKAGADRVYIEWDGDELNSDLIGSDGSYFDNEQIGIAIPRILHQAELHRIKNIIRSMGPDKLHILTDSHGMAEYLKKVHPALIPAGYVGLNITNHRSALVLDAYEFITLSPELSGEEIRVLVRYAIKEGIKASFCVLVQGSCECVISKDSLADLVKAGLKEKREICIGLKDTTGRIFPVITDGFDRTRLLNSVEISLIDYLPNLVNFGITWIVIDARFRGPDYAERMTHIYKKACTFLDLNDQKDIGLLKDAIKAIAYGGLTTGGYRRGITGSDLAA